MLAKTGTKNLIIQHHICVNWEIKHVKSSHFHTDLFK